jgi:hypothetical protein
MTPTQLSDGSRRRYQQRARTTSASLGLVLVVSVGIAAAVWISQVLQVDVKRLTSIPAGLGFTMWSGHPQRGHPGANAPLLAEAPVQAVCTPEHMTFAYGLATLKLRLGERMGEPLECERPVDNYGSTVQITTTGLAAYDQRSQILSFTDRWRHWALTQGHLVSWDGDTATSVQMAVR